jgi:hypothetical protein
VAECISLACKNANQTATPPDQGWKVPTYLLQIPLFNASEEISIPKFLIFFSLESVSPDK